MELPISNIVNVSVLASPTGASAYNTSNIALFTHEAPDPLFADGYKIYKDPNEVAKDFGTSSVTAAMAFAMFSPKPNFLDPGGYLVVIPLDGSETLADAVSRSIPLVEWFAGISTWVESDGEIDAVAPVVQSVNKMFATVQTIEAELEGPDGILFKLTAGSFDQVRGLYYGSLVDLPALRMKAAFVGRGFSTIFAASNSTQTMQLKALAGVQPDPTITQTIFEKTKLAGADSYVSFQGVPSVSSVEKANRFFDQVYNLRWFIGALQIAGFNYLRQTGTKIPQTEAGMDGLKAAYRAVCEQAARNLYIAPGQWSSPMTFGNGVDLLANIAEVGFYIYSTPIALQNQVDREERQAPIVQIAIKEAGAIHGSTVIINVNA